MKKVFKTALILITLVGFVSCHKYPEDNVFIESKSPEKRIVGTWSLTKYYINGADFTDFLFNQYIGFGICGYNSSPPFYQYGNLDFVISKPAPYGVFNYNVLNTGAGGWFYFENKKNDLKMYFGALCSLNNKLLYAPIKGNPNIDPIPFWQIRELTNKSLKITNIIKDTTYRIEFTKQ